MVADFFATFNKAIPLFDESIFKRYVDRQFFWNPDESPSWWASLNVVLAFGYRARAQKQDDEGENIQKSLGHIKNAMDVIVELLMRTADLRAIQAVLGLALYFQNTPNPQALFMFAAMAMRLAHSIGLHRNSTFGLTPSEVLERRRAYWIAFILDADISHRVGRPSVQDADDYDTVLPLTAPDDGLGIFTLESTLLDDFLPVIEPAGFDSEANISSHLYCTSPSEFRQGYLKRNPLL